SRPSPSSGHSRAHHTLRILTSHSSSRLDQRGFPLLERALGEPPTHPSSAVLTLVADIRLGPGRLCPPALELVAAAIRAARALLVGVHGVVRVGHDPGQHPFVQLLEHPDILYVVPAHRAPGPRVA